MGKTLQRKQEIAATARQVRQTFASPDPYADLACPNRRAVLIGKATQGPCPLCPGANEEVAFV